MMADKTLIQWCDATWPIVQGCDPVSPGCAICYVPKELWRMMHNPNTAISGPLQGTVDRRDGKTRFTGKVALREDRLAWPMGWRAPRKIFVPSHGDVFHDKVPDSFLDCIFAVMALCPQHTFQVLTKRPERMRAYCAERPIGLSTHVLDMAPRDVHDYPVAGPCVWPLPNVWLGVSVERQEEADARIPILLDTPAAVRWISAEPLLGPVNLNCVAPVGIAHINALRGVRRTIVEAAAPRFAHCSKLDWVIGGGESGQGAHPMHPHWARSLRDQCAAAGVAFFFKQWGAHRPLTPAEHGQACGAVRVGDDPHDRDGYMLPVGKKKAGRLLDGVEHNAFPVTPTTGASP